MAGKFKSNRDKIEAKFERGMKRNLNAAAIELQNVCKTFLSQPSPPPSMPGNPPGKVTGELRRSVVWDAISANIRRVGSGLLYGKWLEFGTSPYTIVPKKAKRLIWKNDDDEWRSAKKVNHPGIAPRPWLRTSMLYAWEDLKRILGTPI